MALRSRNRGLKMSSHTKKSMGALARQSALPLALALALGPWSAHAATSAWAPTQSHAALLKTVTTTPASGSHAAASQTSYFVNSHRRPQVTAAVNVMDNSKPLHVAVSLNLRNTDQLQAFLKNVSTPGNAQYGKFLTPAQFKAAYAPTDAQVQAVVAHLQQSGFSHVTVSPNNTLVYADGNAATVATAFNATMKSYTENGKLLFGNDSDVMVPQALGSIVGSVVGLQNIEHKHPMSYLGKPVTQAANVTTQEAVTVTHSPTQFPAIYDAGSTPAAFNTTVGIVTWGDLTQTRTDLNTMTAATAMNTTNVRVVPVTLGSAVDFSDDPDSDMEWNLDSQSIVGTSGGVKQLVFYTAANGQDGAADEELTDAGITAAYNAAVTDTAGLAKVINVSLGEDETVANQSGIQAADDAIFAQAVAQGQTFSVASGDQGVYVSTNGEFATGAGVVLPSPFNLSTYSVSEPATSPNVIAVGGTEVSTNGTAWAGETAWNDGIAQADDGNARIWASTGGKSLFESAPSWQSAAPLSATVRQVPDIAFDASGASAAQIFIGGVRYGVSGTSLASPIFVGVFARVQTYANNTIGFPASMMYRDFPTHSAVIHDVVAGNNGVNFGGKTYGYNAATGWDFTTGFGSLDISQFNTLAYGWGNTSLPPTTTPPPPAPTALQNGVGVTTQGQAGSSQEFTLSVPGGATTLTFRTSGGSGDVSLYVKLNAEATPTSYDYSSAHANTNTESVVVRAPAAGTYHVTVTSPAIFTGVTVLGSFN